MTDETKKNPEKKTKRERSTAYPAVPLKEAVELSGKLINAYGKSPFSRDLAVQAIGYKTITGTSAPKVAALVHYGLLERGSNTYKNTALAGRITDFTSEEDRDKALIVAVMAPKLFASLIGEYSGKAIPGLLKNILVSQYKINRKVAENVAETFKESAEFAGVYVNGVITEVPIGSKEDADNIEDDVKINPLSSSVSVPTPKRPLVDEGSASMQKVTLPSGIVISYSTDIAYLFAIGKFGEQIAALDKAVTEAKPKEDNKHGDNDTSTTE